LRRTFLLWAVHCNSCARCCDGALAAFQTLLRQARQGLLGLAVEHLLVEPHGTGGILQAVEIDVTQQQGHEGPPAQYGGLGVRVLRLVDQLVQQVDGKAPGLGVVTGSVSPLGGLILQLEVSVHSAGVVDFSCIASGLNRLGCSTGGCSTGGCSTGGCSVGGCSVGIFER